jgi:hypothetical protein
MIDMRTSKYGEEKIIGFLRQAEAETPLVQALNICN